MLELLRRAIGTEILLDEHEAQPYILHGTLPKVVAPRSSEEAAAVMRVAAEQGWKVLCAGGGTRLDRASNREPDVVITTKRMNAIAEYEPADLVLTAQAGVSLSDIAAATRQNRQFLALDPPVSPASTLGGIVATATAGPLRYAHGTPRDHVLGVEVVAGDARVLHFGGKVVKNVAGYDVVRPLVGSRGTLGLFTEISVRLKPLPETDQTLLIQADSFEAAADVAGAIVAAHLDVVALEIIAPALANELGLDGWVSLVRLHGNRDTVRDSSERVRNAAAQFPVTQTDEKVWRALSVAEGDAAWHVRFANLPSLLRDTAAAAARVAERTSAGSAPLAVHAGDGIVRLLMNDVTRDFDEVVEYEREALERRGGTLIVERAARPVAHAFGRVEGIPLMAGVKRVFDPAGILATEAFAV